MAHMKVLHSIHDFRAWRAANPAPIIPFVPTMGALHEGHISLLHQARQLAGPSGRVLASIFVNPTQFGPSEDFSRYPRSLENDCALLDAARCDAVFVPAAEEMYPGIAQLSTQHSALRTSIDPGPLADLLEGAIRPGHFRGVCTVVAKLLLITQPTHLLLGQKDFQQQAILRQMTLDLNFPVTVVTCPTLRESDGLAMSSRNRYLTPDQRPRATAIYQALQWAKSAYDSGEKHPAPLAAGMQQRIAAAGLTVQYALPVHARFLTPFTTTITGPAALLVAAQLGATRLIDNLLLSA